MNEYHNLPQSKDFGLDFNYALWSAGTVVTLCNVPWNSDYRDIVRFDNEAALDYYIENQTGPKVQIDNVSYAKVGRPVRLSIPFSAAYKYNYLKAHNPVQPVAGDEARSYYYFVTDVVYVAPNTTEIYIQLDVWQTFGYRVEFGNCYIERGHVGIANENSFNDYGREFLTIPEGLDIGGEYQIIDQWTEKIASARDGVLGDNTNPDYDILVVSTVALNEEPGTVDAPKLESATGSQMENLPNGAEMYLFPSLDGFKLFMETYSDRPWITQGIISITAIPSASRYGIETTIKSVYAPAGDATNIAIREVNPGPLENKMVSMKPNWRDDIDLGRYEHLKKFLTFPYMVLEMTTYAGTPLVIKPESWNDPDGTIVEVPHFAPPGPRLMFFPLRYNSAQSGYAATYDEFGIVNDGGEFLDMATGIINFPAFSVVNDGYMSFMASNANGIAFQHASAEWSQQKALTGNQLAFDQASAGMGLSQNVNQLGINAATASTNLANETAGYRAIQGGINGAVGGLGRGGAMGAIGALGSVANSAAGYAIETNQNNQALGISNNLSASVNRAQVGNMGYMRDSNKSYADYATRGDYQNSIAAINAKVQDARLIQPTTSGQVGGDAFNLARYKWGYDIKLKMLQPAAMAVLGEYWLRYGYAVQRFGRMPADFQVMSKCTYWKLRETYVSSSQCPETFKQTIRGIFEKGVTVWKNPSDIGNIDFADNTPLEGVVL